MVNKKMLFVFGSALVIGLLGGCGTGDKINGSSKEIKAETPKENEIAPKFLPTIEIKAEKNTMIVQYKVKNISGESKKLTFPSGLESDFIIYDQAGKKVKQFSDEVMSTQAIKELTLENNQEIAKEFTISDLPNGQYKIELFLTAKEVEANVVTDLIIKNSFTNGIGVLVGQIDPHTIEINMDGKKVAFQLTDEAQKQLTTIKEGRTVSFDYIENDLGQKIIQKFLID